MSEIAMDGKVKSWSFDRSVSNLLQELEQIQNTILATEEALLETLCFEFWVESPHVQLIQLLEVYAPQALQDYAWSIAHDSLVIELAIYSRYLIPTI